MRKGSMVLLVVIGLISLSAFSQTQDDFLPSLAIPESDFQSDRFAKEFIVFLGCIVLVAGWAWQLYMVFEQRKMIDDSSIDLTSKFSNWIPVATSPRRWRFLLIVLLFPVGLSLIPRILPMNEDVFLPGLAYQFAVNIFIIMITLEIAAIYNSRSDEWRQMLTSVLAIDLLAFAGFSLMGKPNPEQTLYNILTIISFTLSGLLSLVSSFFTLFYARSYEEYQNREDQQHPDLIPDPPKAIIPSQDDHR